MQQPMKRTMHRTTKSGALRIGRWTLVAGAAMALSVGIVFRGGATASPGQPLAPESRWVAAPAQLVETELSALRAPEAQPEQLYLDPLETLRSYWGAAWPDVEAQLFPEGLEAAELAPIVPWPDVEEIHLEMMAPNQDSRVEALYRRLVAWPGWEFHGANPYRPDSRLAELTPDSLFWATRCSGVDDLSQADVEALETQFVEVNSELDGLARAFIEGAGAAVRFEFERGGFERAPVAFLEEAAKAEDELYSRKVSAGGWVTRIQITASGHPGLGLLREEIERLRARRAEDLRAAVQALKSSRPAPQPAS